MRDLAAVLRSGELIGSDVVLVRGGVDTPEKLRAHAEDMARRFVWRGEPATGVSAFGAPLENVHEVLADKLTSYPHYRLVHVAALRHAGFEVLPTFRSPHVTILLPDVEAATLAALLDTFGAVRDNLEYRRRRNRRRE